jgi:hypothetical protein
VAASPTFKKYVRTIPTGIVAITAFFLAVALLLLLFHDLGVENNRIRVTNELVGLATRAQEHYRRAIIQEGGAGSFQGLEMWKLTRVPEGQDWVETEDGRYTILELEKDRLLLEGVGKELGTDDSMPVRVVLQVWADSARVVLDETN